MLGAASANASPIVIGDNTNEPCQYAGTVHVGGIGAQSFGTIVYDNTASAANTATSSTNLGTAWGDECVMTSGGNARTSS